MNAAQKSVAVAVGALVFGAWGVQPLAAEESSRADAPLTYSFCAGLEGAARDDCMRRSASSGESYVPANEPRGVLGRAGDERATEEAIPASTGALQPGSNPANVLCDSQSGASREHCVSALSTDGLQQGAGD